MRQVLCHLKSWHETCYIFMVKSGWAEKSIPWKRGEKKIADNRNKRKNNEKFIPEFGKGEDEEELRTLFCEHGMDLAGDIEEHLILRVKNQIVAGGKIVEVGQALFFLEVLGVKRDQINQGWGGILLEQMLRNPWQSSLSVISWQSSHFRIGTLARGGSTGFYHHYGFLPCSFEEIPEPYQEQCTVCPDQLECRPVPMMMNWEEKSNEKSNCCLY